MSSRYRYTSMDRVFSMLDRDMGSNFNEDDIIEWTGDALEFMATVKSYEEKVCFKIVENHQCDIPKWSHGIIQIAKDNTVVSTAQAVFLSKTVTEELGVNLVLTDSGEIVQAKSSATIANQQTNQLTLNINYKGWIESGYYKSRFTTIRLKESSFFNTIVCKEADGIVPYDVSVDRDEYTIINGDTLRFSFKEGMVGIAYLRQALDEKTGYPLVPDNISILTAIKWYIQMNTAYKEATKGRQGALGWAEKCEQKWQWYCGQGSAVDMMPYGIDEYQNLLDQRSYLLPRNNKYLNFFGYLARPEVRKFNNPDKYR